MPAKKQVTREMILAAAPTKSIFINITSNYFNIFIFIY